MMLDSDDTCQVRTPESMCDFDPTPAPGHMNGTVKTSRGDALPDATSSPSSADSTNSSKGADGRSETPETDGETGPESTPAVANAATLTKDPTAVTKPARRRPIPRKGHTKSRRGCYNCKRRKVKCPEGLPQCQQCCRLGLKCEYPPPKVAPREYDGLMAGAPNSSMIMAPAKSLDSAPLFCLDDMRFMQHFLTYGHPSMPIGEPSVWLDVGKMAHNYDFLMHSILGLAAFHLDQFVPGKGYDQQALQHRLKAIKKINEFLALGNFNISDGDAAFGALISLVYQTSYMEDAVLEYITMMRGCYLVIMQAMPNWSLSRFESFTNNVNADASNPVRSVACQLRIEQPVALPPPLYRTNDALLFHNSIGAVLPHCRTPMEHGMLVQMQRAVRAAQVDAMVGFREASAIYNMFGQLSAEEFAAATNPDDALWQVILAHFILVDYVIGAHLPLFHGFSRKEGGATPLGGSPKPIKGHHDRRTTIARWVCRIWQALEKNAEMRQLVHWPVEFVSWLLEMPKEVRPLGLPPPSPVV